MRRMGGAHWWLGLVLLAGVGLHVWSLDHLRKVPRVMQSEEMRIAMPRSVQLVAAAGDRHLAANFAAIRALVAPLSGMSSDQYRIQALVQKDAAVLNPAHQDNYFIASAVLPWNGEVDAAQFVLRKATAAREFDLWPPYNFAFNEWYIRKNPLEASRWLELAASRTTDYVMHYSLKDMAAAWLGTHDDLALAIRMVRGMAEATNEKSFRRFLLLRVVRLEGLAVLRDAVKAYRGRHGRSPQRLEDLLTAGLLKEIPQDPFRVGYAINPQGEVVFVNQLKRAAKAPAK